MATPSAKRIAEFMGVPMDVAKAARIIMKKVDDGDMRRRDGMDALDKLFGTHGVEFIAQRPYDTDVGESFYYLNSGDSYNATIVRKDSRWILTTVGDLIESLERRGKRFN